MEPRKRSSVPSRPVSRSIVSYLGAMILKSQVLFSVPVPHQRCSRYRVSWLECKRAMCSQTQNGNKKPISIPTLRPRPLNLSDFCGDTMNTKRNHPILFLSLTLALLSGYGANATEKAEAMTSPVVMVCENGAVKSVIAARLFDQEAMKRGLHLRAISRGVSPEEYIPENIVEDLATDGFDVSSLRPQALSNQEAANSARLIAIGTDLSAFQSDAPSPILQWDGIPSAIEDYETSKASLLAHVQALLDELEEQAN